MLKVCEVTEKEWDHLRENFADRNYQSTWAFGTISAKTINAKSNFIKVVENNEIIALAHLRIKVIPILKIGVAYLNSALLTRQLNTNDDPDETFEKSIKALMEEYSQKRGLVLRIKCPLKSERENEYFKGVLHNFEFSTPFATDEYRTLLLDITSELSQTRRVFKGKWRNQLNAAERNELELRSGSGKESFQVFSTIFEDLKSRKKFDVSLDVSFFEEVQEMLQEPDKFYFHFVYKDGQLLAGHMGYYSGEIAVYILGASTHAGNKLKASYLLQWAALQYARKKGCKYYDLGGIDPIGNKGVYHFKQGMAGIETIAAGPMQIGNKIPIMLLNLYERLMK